MSMSHEADGGILSDGYFLRSGFPRTCCHDLIFALIDAGRQPDMSLFFSSVRPMLDHGRPTPVELDNNTAEAAGRLLGGEFPSLEANQRPAGSVKNSAAPRQEQP